MSERFFEQPILNSPYEPPRFHHDLDADGQPTDLPPVAGRRRSELITPVPKPKKKKGKAAPAEQTGFVFADQQGLTTAEVEYNPTPIINEIRQHVESWRNLPNPAHWKVTPATARLLQHWRHHEFSGVRPFFCQVEAVETIIWLTEVAPGNSQYKKVLEHVEGANLQANPELLRMAMKMATGSGKTTVMAMLIAWQTVNAVRHPNSKRFSKGFLIVTPGITIKDRLRVLQPNDPDSYYKNRELVPADMLPDIDKAKIVITNYHAFKLRERMEVSKLGRALLKGRDGDLNTAETEGQMLQRVMPDLMGMKSIVVLNDEAHHCYRERPGVDDGLTGDEKKEAEKNNEAARLWITGIETVKRHLGVRGVYDLSATPFFLRGSGYAEGTLFPWTVSDFSLMDAIECGIVKLPRVPVADNLPTGEMPVYRNLWEHIGKKMPKKGRGKGGELDPRNLPSELQTALDALYGHYTKVFDLWEEKGIGVPPVFIIVCNNTSSSKLVYEFISGWTRTDENGNTQFNQGRLELFRNYDDYGNRLPRMRTLLIDSEQLESDEALDTEFRAAAAEEIDQFKRELIQRDGAGAADKLTDKDLLREVMNTVGRKGRLGEQVRCVVSVSMLTEGWDTNTVTHILGVRAFGTQLLCEQVVGRALRRQSYELNDQGLFNAEYADVLGIPFDFTAKPVVAKPATPRETVRVQAVKERADLEILYPRVEGYRVELPNDRLSATFSENSTLYLTPELVGPCSVLLEGIVGEGVTLNVDHLEKVRPSTIAYNLAKHLLFKHFRDPGEEPKLHLFGPLKRITKQWLDAGHLKCAGGTFPAQLMYQEIADQAAERIYLACQAGLEGERRIKAILDPYNPTGSTRFVNFTTSKELRWETSAKHCHVNLVICDSEWEAEFARVAEEHPSVLAYVKNQGLGFEVPYRDGSTPRKYIPDFILRVDDGRPDPLNLIVEIKGYRRGDAQLKAETMNTLWVPGVNNLGRYGRWAFAEFHHVFEIEQRFGELIQSFLQEKAA
ncbi:BPTD_3080 family restriction endonuclease [Azospirillum lipoferum]|uniref:Type III restriction endonuclease, res subunit n=1 Tax=Azospirillum lipoferum (strain 4B) TaxID=862719 RepID=G7Z1X2_AZOL4|nr:DEAD/DEAH box helicase family protein [Azospirillum lipoferum]CBS87322.1 Putative Type III restriction endonuclease, res subunit [Azospirillum lipoferum 4B]